MAFRETITRHALARGNGFAEILRLANGEAYALQPVDPDIVKIKPGPDGHVAYEVAFAGNSRTIPDTDMIHIHGLSSDGLCGISVAGLARENLEFAGSAQAYGRNLFSSGGRPGGILTHPAKLTKEAKDSLREAWDGAYGGKNTGKTAVLDHGIDYKPITINPVDAQFLETRQFSCEEIARWFRMPLHKIQYLVRAQGWSTLDAQNTDYLTDCLMPWLVRWEEELDRKLFADSEYFAEHLVIGLLRGDQASRASFYTSQFSIGALSINEIREFENMNPIEGEGGDKHFVPMNMTPAEFANSVSGGGAAKAPAIAPAQEPSNA
jgi:HK97 family phage portal protein